MPARFIYIHLRKDNGECFYVGKGIQRLPGNTPKTRYLRAYTKGNRNADWHNIVNSVGFEVKIIQDNISTDEEAAIAERQWVAHYWDWDTLVNRTHGGCGLSGYRHSPEAIERSAALRRGRRGDLCKNSKPVYVYDAKTGMSLGRYGSRSVAAEALHIANQNIWAALRHYMHYASGYLFYPTDQGEKVSPIVLTPRMKEPLKIEQVHLTEDVVIATFNDQHTAYRATGLSLSGISRTCRGLQSCSRGYRWRFVAP